MARVTITPEAARQLDALGLVLRARVMRVLLRLERWPEVSGARPLAGQLAGRWRVRTGDYRVQFREDAGGIVVEKIGHRDGFDDA